MFLLYLFHLIHFSLLAYCSVLSVHGLPVICVLTSEYFVMFSGYVFITNMVAKIFCPDKQIANRLTSSQVPEYEKRQWATKIDIFFYQIWCPEKVDNLQKFCCWRNKIFAGILIFLVFSNSGIEYLWQREISACKLTVPIKVVPVRNDHYYSPIY